MKNKNIIITTEEEDINKRERNRMLCWTSQLDPIIETDQFILFTKKSISMTVVSALEILLENIDKISVMDLEKLTKNK